MTKKDSDADKFMSRVSLKKEPLRQKMLAMRAELDRILWLNPPFGFDVHMNAFLAVNKKLSLNGWENWPHGYTDTFKGRERAVFQLVEWLHAMLKPGLDFSHAAGSIRLRMPRSTGSFLATSYGLKHIIERHRGIYTGNGELILACMIAGFHVGEIVDPNCSISIEETSLDDVIKSVKHIGLVKRTYDSPEEVFNEGKRTVERTETWIDAVPYHLRDQGTDSE